MKKSSHVLSLIFLASACGGGGPSFKPVTVDVEKFKFNPPNVMQMESKSAYYSEDNNAGQWKPMKMFEVFTLLGLPANEILMSTNIALAKTAEKNMRTDISKRSNFMEVKAAYTDLWKNYNLKAKPAADFESPNEKNIVYNYDAEKKTEMHVISPIIIKAYNQIFLDVMIYMNAVEMTSEDGVFDAQDFPVVDIARTKMEDSLKTQSEIIKKEKNILIERFLRETNKPRYVAVP